jgi:membrane protein insertase Oxa1/YidC/SpoIIIJ
MAALWGVFLEVFQVGLFWLTQFYGGHLASAIVTFSLLARIALLPLTVSLAVRARAHTRRLRAIRPQLDRVRERWAKDPQRLMKETMAVYERRGVSPMDAGLLKRVAWLRLRSSWVYSRRCRRHWLRAVPSRGSFGWATWRDPTSESLCSP